MKRILLAILLVSLVSACICPSGNNNGETGGQQDESQTVTTTLKPSTGSITEGLVDIAQAITSGQGYKCTYTYQGIQSETWIKGDKYRAKTIVEGETFNSMSDGTWAYVWGEGENTGTKFKISDFQTEGEPTEQTQGYSDIQEIQRDAVDIDCRPAAVQDSTFSPPATVQFQDMGELLGQLGGMQGSPGQDTCSYCNMMPNEESKQQCLDSCQTA